MTCPMCGYEKELDVSLSMVSKDGRSGLSMNICSDCSRAIRWVAMGLHRANLQPRQNQTTAT